MRTKMTVMVLYCLFLMNSCAEFEDQKADNTNSADRVKVTKNNFSELVTTQVVATQQPEKYRVYFGWPRFDSKYKLRIRQGSVLAVVNSNQTTFSQEVNHHQSITYTFDLLESNNQIIKSFSKLVIIPQDFVVKVQKNEFKQDTQLKVNRFYISDTPLITNGHQIEIMSNEFHSDKGTISTFNENSKAMTNENKDITNGVNGLGGGKIIIQSKVATGQLRVILRGQNGGDGNSGLPFTHRAQDGSAPGVGSLECDGPRDRFPFSFLSNDSPSILPMGCSCLITGSDGSNGSPGLKGQAGGNAGHGGNTGSLKIEIEDGSAFHLETEKIIGQPGQPGPGGPGQPGGIALGSSSRCSGKMGLNGSRGPKGDPGQHGQFGQPEQICLYIASEEKNECF